MSSRSQEFHKIHQTLARRRDRVYLSPERHTSSSIFAKDEEWSGVLELACAEADGKFAVSIQYGVRNETIESRFAAAPRSLSLSKFLTIDPSIDPQSLAEKLERTLDELDQLLTDVASIDALLQIIEAQGGSALIFGSWTNENSFSTGRTASEIRAALR